MAGAVDGLVHTSGGPVPYLRWARPAPDAPTALLLHGLTSSARTWLDLGTHLSDRLGVYAIEQRGHGRAARLPRAKPDFTIDRFAGDAVEFLGALKLCPTVVLGHSWGAAATLIAAAALFAERPDHAPKAVILEDPVHAVGTERQRAMAGKMLSLQSLDTDDLSAALQEAEPSLTDQQLAERLAELRGTDSGLLHQVSADNTERSLLPLLTDLRCPVLLLLADESLSRVFDNDTLARALPLLPAGSHVVRVPRAAHVVHRTQPDRATWEIDTFLKSLL